MTTQAFKANLRLYIHLEETRARLTQELFEISNQQGIVEKALSGVLPGSIPEDFVFPCNGKSYRFLMDLEDGGILNFAEMEDLDTWLSQHDPENLAMDELRKDAHQEYYRPSGEVE